MDSIIINGGNALKGNISISGSKNASLPIMAASLLTDQILELTNLPILSDISTMEELLINHGANIGRTIKNNDSLTLKISTSNINNYKAPYEIVRRMRASIWVLGPLVAKYGRALVSLPGGCAIGARQVDLHIAVLEAMGVEIEILDGYIYAHTKKRLKACSFIFPRVSVGATINAILAASLADGVTHLSNCAKEPEIKDLCICLVKMGAVIEGVGTDDIKITGQRELHGTKHNILPDRIEAGTYMIAAAITKGDVTISGIDYDIVENIALKLIQAGVEVINSNNIIQVKYNGVLKSVDMSTSAYPGFATDLQAQFMSLMTLSEASSVITENIFENRFMHVSELCRMGANIIVDGKHAIVRGIQNLKGAEVMASDLRASVSLVLAGLAATGTTKVRRVYHLDRGYQSLEKKLSACGADIVRVKGDSV
ncbi:MAG: UDP-N-acetylglucosamine 1-carboxyvinyltransferase [Rickettsiaceae bacterium]